MMDSTASMFALINSCPNSNSSIIDTITFCQETHETIDAYLITLYKINVSVDRILNEHRANIFKEMQK